MVGSEGSMHTSVLLKETIDLLAVRPGGVYVDATLGAAGHTEEILARTAGQARVIGIDQDPDALLRSRERLGPLARHCEFVRGNSRDLLQIVADLGVDQIDGMVLDSGCSSEQLDTASRGFSFRHDGPLDMRMDPDAGESARELLDRADEAELAFLLRHYGEERQAKRIARAILERHRASALETTVELAEVIEKAAGGRKGARIHPATRSFQAIRIAVNDELKALEAAVEAGIWLLAPGGRVAVITFQSLEHRVVKRCFAEHVGKNVSLQQGGSEWQGREPRLLWTAKRAIKASAHESRTNPRARSAMLRGVRAFREQERAA